MKTISEDEYLEACNDYMGYCIKCKDFTRECTEPDAEKYDCPDCESNSVYGSEQCIIMGLFDIDF